MDPTDPRFAMGEAIADMLALAGASSLIVGGEALVHARRLEVGQPVEWMGVGVAVGDLVEVRFTDERHRELSEMVGIVRHINVETGDLSVVSAVRGEWSASFMSLGRRQRSGTGFGRRVLVLEAGAVPNILDLELSQDIVVEALDQLAAAYGAVRARSEVDRRIRASSGEGRVHGVIEAQARALCGIPAVAGAAEFGLADPRACQRCVSVITAAAHELGCEASVSDRAVRMQVLARTGRRARSR